MKYQYLWNQRRYFEKKKKKKETPLSKNSALDNKALHTSKIILIYLKRFHLNAWETCHHLNTRLLTPPPRPLFFEGIDPVN